MWALSEETLRAEATRVFTETGGSAAAIKLSIIQLECLTRSWEGKRCKQTVTEAPLENVINSSVQSDKPKQGGSVKGKMEGKWFSVVAEDGLHLFKSKLSFSKEDISAMLCISDIPLFV